MGYSPWGLKESDTTEQVTFTSAKLPKMEAVCSFTYSSSSLTVPFMPVARNSRTHPCCFGGVCIPRGQLAN